MAREEIAPVLAKDFVVVKVDTDRTVGGKEMFEGTKGKGNGIPWFVFLDAEGKSLADSNGPKGNIGCPYQDDEIEFFIETLKKIVVNMKDDDLAALKKSLLAQQEKKK